MIKIIYADDEYRYRKLVSIFLEKESYKLILAENGAEVFDLLNKHPDTSLIILDLMMPIMDGYDTCKEINKEYSIPILMLTALGSLEDEIHGIKTGADDYISKPFKKELLLARIEALLRRNNKLKKKMEQENGIELRNDEYIVVVNNRKILLAPMEFKLFEYLFINRDIILSRYKILDNVWGYDYDGDPRTVDTHIKILRAKLGSYGERIVTVRTKGYSFKGDRK